MTSYDIKLQLAFYCRFKRQALMLADEVSLGSFVADFVAIISYKLYEFEIKTSISDLKNDFFKSRYGSGVSYKHDIIQAGKGAHYFYFVVPRELIEKTKEIVPPTLGIMSVADIEGLNYDCSSIYVVRRSKLLRRSCITSSQVEAIFKRQQSLIYEYYKNEIRQRKLLEVEG